MRDDATAIEANCWEDGRCWWDTADEFCDPVFWRDVAMLSDPQQITEFAHVSKRKGESVS
jgi:hypothetical protein